MFLEKLGSQAGSHLRIAALLLSLGIACVVQPAFASCTSQCQTNDTECTAAATNT